MLWLLYHNKRKNTMYFYTAFLITVCRSVKLAVEQKNTFLCTFLGVLSPVTFSPLIYFDYGMLQPNNLFWQVALTLTHTPAPYAPFRCDFIVTYLFNCQCAACLSSRLTAQLFLFLFCCCNYYIIANSILQ